MFAHTPYDGSSKPFTIGLRPLDPTRWIEPDDGLKHFLAEKRRLFAQQRGDVFTARADTQASQSEIRDALADYLTRTFPDLYIREDAGIVITPLRQRVAFDDDLPPLMQAALLVQDDLALMRRFDDGWRLAAAAICFPSTWLLREKFDRNLADIHAPVPGFPGGMEQRVTRIFDNLRAEAPVERFNWSIYDSETLHHPHPSPQAPATADAAFIRVERQSLRKMPQSGDILFTIRILVDPIAALRHHPDGANLATALRRQLLALTPEQLTYKNMVESRDRIAHSLAALIAAD
ncbi:MULTISPECIES: DUF3445 domain-containing protein [unclassified Beijerinckia]|uniref:heme-dependent oxidative N-demethylase family protein n=1 Tax=unclassified Beijerinckia TaxID=2638183 RepID=UPI00089A943E|nr:MULTISPECIES: DUF3445 domain-containing protein [unclassified Beijerinckia]MDH7798523.1 hypothetical protein [Beijerinckia sp. GAS462]SED23717.1 Protein of unknown function [Beijerinckia sp. 28-YEA-48]